MATNVGLAGVPDELGSEWEDGGTWQYFFNRPIQSPIFWNFSQLPTTYRERNTALSAKHAAAKKVGSFEERAHN